MRLIFKLMIVLTAVAVLMATSPRISFADAQITENSPQTVMTPEKKLGGEGGGKWLWALLGVVLVGGVAAAAGGGGGGGGGGGDDGPTTGSVSGRW